MKKFNISVNGTSYEVEVEEVGGMASAPISRPTQTPNITTAPAASASATPASAPKTVPAAPIAGDGEVVASPMPGTILDIKVNVGDKVASGAVLVILEAMKMENEIMAPTAGTVKSISVTKGASVNSGDVLVVIG